MEFVFDDMGVRTEYEAVVTDPTARVSDLARALGTNPMALVVDGRFVAGSVGLRASGLVTGSTVAPATAVSHVREAPRRSRPESSAASPRAPGWPWWRSTRRG